MRRSEASRREGGVRRILTAMYEEKPMKSNGRFRLFTVSITTLLLCGLAVGSTFFTAKTTHAASYCQVTYTITNQWQGGFGTNITIQNTSSTAWTSWRLAFTFPASGQAVTQSWNGSFSQSGQN